MKRNANMINIILMMAIVYIGGAVYTQLNSLKVDAPKLPSRDVIVGEYEFKQMQGLVAAGDPTNEILLLDKPHVEPNLKIRGMQPTPKIEITKNISVPKIELAKLQPVVLGYNTKVKLGMIEPVDPDKATSHSKHTAEGAGSAEDVSHSGYRYEKRNIQVTFYGNNPEETDSTPNTVASNKHIAPGMVAMNGVKFGTKVHIPELDQHIPIISGIDTFVVEDRMATHEAAKASTRMDIFVPRLDGESKSEYMRRVNSYGRYTVEGYVGFKK